MATLSAQERDLQAQNTYKRWQISPFGVRKPVFCVETRPFEALPEYTWRKRSIPTHSGWLYPLTFDAGKGLKEA